MPDRLTDLYAAVGPLTPTPWQRGGRYAYDRELLERLDDEDPANLASDLYQDELDESLRDNLEAELAAVERAEARLAAHTYGLSTRSGQPIPDERLEALPTAELTVEEERAEEGG